MTHVPSTNVHRYVGDAFVLRVSVDGLAAADVDEATWVCGSVSKEVGSGVTVTDDGGTARLDVEVTASDTTSIGAGGTQWQATAGESPAPVVAVGSLFLDERL